MSLQQLKETANRLNESEDDDTHALGSSLLTLCYTIELIYDLGVDELCKCIGEAYSLDVNSEVS